MFVYPCRSIFQQQCLNAVHTRRGKAERLTASLFSSTPRSRKLFKFEFQRCTYCACSNGRKPLWTNQDQDAVLYTWTSYQKPGAWKTNMSPYKKASLHHSPHMCFMNQPSVYSNAKAVRKPPLTVTTFRKLPHGHNVDLQGVLWFHTFRWIICSVHILVKNFLLLVIGTIKKVTTLNVRVNYE